MKIGWLQDEPGYIGGAELNANAYRAQAPEGVEIVDCPYPNYMEPGCDMYMVHNCSGYDRSIIPVLETAPVYKMCHDIYPHGDPVLREWLLSHSKRVILVSPKVKDWMPWPIHAPIGYVPSCIDVPRFANAANGAGRDGYVYLGQFNANKGVIEAAEWVYKNAPGTRLDAYGWGDMRQIVDPIDNKGTLDYSAIPGTLAHYKTLVFLPMAPDACPRVIFEAWAAGCEIVTNGMQGATWWIENDPDAIRQAGKRFWEMITND